jgi:hypothetical protein
MSPFGQGLAMSVKRFQVRDDEGKLCSSKCWVSQTVGGYRIGIEILSKRERFEGFSDASHEQIAWYDVKTQIQAMGYRIVEDFHEY